MGKYKHLTKDRYNELKELTKSSTIPTPKLAKIVGVANSTLYLIGKFDTFEDYQEYNRNRLNRQLKKKPVETKVEPTKPSLTEEILNENLGKLGTKIDSLVDAMKALEIAVYSLRKSVKDPELSKPTTFWGRK